ncbi:MAG: cupin domain-containing protein [Bacteroidota bacterium]
MSHHFRSIIALCLINLFCLNLQAQSDKESLSPIPLPKEALSGIGLKKIDLPKEPDRDFFQKRLHRGQEISVYILASESATTDFSPIPFDEFVYLINGGADVKNKKGAAISFRSGDMLIGPKGFEGDWSVNAGETYHLELSVITNARIATDQQPALPMLMDRDKLSGIGLTADAQKPGHYHDLLYKGPELSFLLTAEPGQSIDIASWEREELIYILAGQVQIETKDGQVFRFHRGDFFVMPEGFSGRWQSEGHQLFRILRIRKTA